MDLGKYLGMPSLMGMNKSSQLLFSALKDRKWQSIDSCSSKLLSIAGKKVLIKFVAQEIPTYVMSCFKMAKGTINDLNGVIAKYWWGKMGGNRGIYLESWLNLCLPKLAGEGFSDFESFNEALLAKQCWIILQKPNSLTSVILKAKFLVHVLF